MERALRKNLLILIILNLSLILFAILYSLAVKALDGGGGEISCTVQKNLHMYCPGCGGSRSLYSFITLDLLNSFRLYPPIPLSAIAVFSYDVRLFLTLLKKNTRYTDGYKFTVFLIIPISILLTFIVRNILLLGFGIDTVGDFLH